MCRMIAAPLGASGDLLIDPFLRMAQGLNRLSELNQPLGSYTHGHGWGAVIDAGSEELTLRRVNACWDDRSVDALRDKTVLLLHARMASQGAINSNNVHPFQALEDGSQWSFCHNGTVREALTPPATLRTPDCTDSEIVFHQLLPYLKTNQVLEGIRAIYGAITDFTSLNTFLLGSEALWVVCLYTEMPEYYTLHLAVTDQGPIISSEVLSEVDTQPEELTNGEILRIDRASGRIDKYTL